MFPTETHVSANPVRAALESCKPHLLSVAIFSAVSNLLYLVPSIYMMQVYDRVLPTGGLVTLTAVSIVALAGIALLSALEWLRSRILVRASMAFDNALAPQVLATTMARQGLDRVRRGETMRDFDSLRQAISGPAVLAAFDVPWFPIYILVAFLLHPLLGLVSLIGAAVLLVLTRSNEVAVRGTTQTAAEAASAAYARQAHSAIHAQEVRALGMVGALTRLHLADRIKVNQLQTRAGFASGNHLSVVKFVRLVLQSAALCVGAILVVEGKLSGGSMMAASLLLSRALAPIEQIVAAWKPLLGARASYRALHALLDHPVETSHTILPEPQGLVEVQSLVVATPQGDRVALADVNFSIDPGQIIGLVGPSGAGKSSLLRAMAGAERVIRGHVRFDGASANDWDRERLALLVGYLPQNFVLFAGTVKQNIARFQGSVHGDTSGLDSAAIEAARGAFAHDMILQLPQGYDTVIGPGGSGLSAGQMQRVAIARALFGNPRVLLLDEPTAHLDPEAIHAFVKTLSQLRQRRTSVLFATHSGDVLASADKILALRDGRVESFASIHTSPRLTSFKPVAHMPVKASS